MALKTEFTWRYVAKTVLAGPLDPEIRSEAWGGLKCISYALVCLVLRTLMLVTFPVSVPVLVYGFRTAERRRQARREATRAVRDADV